MNVYGEQIAGSSFELNSYIRRPTVISRFLCWLFSIVVFGCISSEGWFYNQCIFNQDSEACHYGVGIGVIAFIASLIFLFAEAMFDTISSVKIRRRYVMIDIGFSVLWTFLWFVGFCYLTNAWNKSYYATLRYGADNARAAISFSFFSIFTWGFCSFYAFQRYRQGVHFESNATDVEQSGPAYPNYPGTTDFNAYQTPPFSSTGQAVPSEPQPFSKPTY